MWYIGAKFVLKGRPLDPPAYEVANTEFIHAHTSIPIPKIAKDWVDKDGRQFLMVDRVEGENLQTAWPTLPQDAKIRVAEQTANSLQQLRNLQSDKMASLGEAPLYSGWLFLQDIETPRGPFASEDELWQSLVRKLEKLRDTAREAFRKRLPPCAPYTFTHCDLATANIIVKDGNLAAIIDWEGAGYFPLWWEYTATVVGLSAEDEEWKNCWQAKYIHLMTGKRFGRTFVS